jgi:hypothetical protein
VNFFLFLIWLSVFSCIRLVYLGYAPCSATHSFFFLKYNGRQILFACRKLSWNLFQKMWCVVCRGFSASRGTSSGILLIWDMMVVEKIKECVGEFTVACSFKNIDYGFSWAFVGVYVPSSDYNRRLLW